MRKMRVVEQEAAAVHIFDGEGNHLPPLPEELYTAPAAAPEQLSVPLLDNIDNL